MLIIWDLDFMGLCIKKIQKPNEIRKKAAKNNKNIQISKVWSKFLGRIRYLLFWTKKIET